MICGAINASISIEACIMGQGGYSYPGEELYERLYMLVMKQIKVSCTLRYDPTIKSTKAYQPTYRIVRCPSNMLSDRQLASLHSCSLCPSSARWHRAISWVLIQCRSFVVYPPAHSMHTYTSTGRLIYKKQIYCAVLKSEIFWIFFLRGQRKPKLAIILIT